MNKKQIQFLGDSLSRIRDFPEEACTVAGQELRRLQFGEEPHDWKPIKAVGAGAREIRIWDAEGTFRLIYVASINDRVYVLHAFQKKTEKTEKYDVDLARQRYKQIKGAS